MLSFHIPFQWCYQSDTECNSILLRQEKKICQFNLLSFFCSRSISIVQTTFSTMKRMFDFLSVSPFSPGILRSMLDMCQIIWFETSFMNFVFPFFREFFFIKFSYPFAFPRTFCEFLCQRILRNGISLESDWDFVDNQPGTIYTKIYRDEIAFDIYLCFFLSSFSFFFFVLIISQAYTYGHMYTYIQMLKWAPSTNVSSIFQHFHAFGIKSTCWNFFRINISLERVQRVYCKVEVILSDFRVCIFPFQSLCVHCVYFYSMCSYTQEKNRIDG